jgi:hypothetical protein
MPRSTWIRIAGLVAGVTVVLAVMLTAFAWPAIRSAPHDLPFAVAGPPPAVAQVAAQLEQRSPGVFRLVRLAGRDAARDAIRDRRVYGALVLEPMGATMLVATAASPVVAQALSQFAGGLSTSTGARVAVEDVVPAPAADPRGAGLAAGALPLALGGIVVAALLIRLVAGVVARLVGALAASLVAGLVLTAILQGWFGSLDGNYWFTSAAMALGIAASAAALLGLGALFGLAGLAVGAALVVLLGYPLSGIANAPEMLPPGWGTLGQLMPPGATGSLLRSVAFFDGAGAGRPVAVLLGWLAAGLLMWAVSIVLARRGHPVGELPPAGITAPAAQPG